MALQASIITKEVGYNFMARILSLKFMGNYGVAGVGDILDLSNVTNLANIADAAISRTPTIPLGIYTVEAGGYYIGPVLGLALNNSSVKVYAPGGAELATGAAYPPAVLNGTFAIRVHNLKGI